jgi:hypothetical protein
MRVEVSHSRYQALAAELILDAVRQAAKPMQSRSTKHFRKATKRSLEAYAWLTRPSTLDFFAAILGHHGDHYRRMFKKLIR